MQTTASNNDSRPVFPYHVHDQTDFDNPFINGRDFIYLSISKMTFTFLKYIFSFINFILATRKWENKSVPIELVTPSITFYFPTSS